MKEDDFKTGGPEPADPLSATGMFLRTLGDSPEAAPKADPVKAGPAPAVRPESPSAPSHAGPGEFTQMFQAHEQPSAPRSQSPPASNDRPPVGRIESPAGQSAQGPGEFTRVFLGEASSAAAPPSRAVPQSPMPAAVQPVVPVSALPPRKGFSSPGASDSASGEGAFTRMFQAMPAPQSAAPPAPLTPASGSPQAPGTAGPVWNKWPSQATPEQSADKPASTNAPGQSATGLISSLSSSPGPGHPSEATPNWAPSPTPYSSLPPDPSGSDAGSVTRLIERLSQVNRETPAGPPPPVTSAPPVVSGPGEMTRILSGDVLQQKSAAPPAAKAAPMPAMPVVALPAMPTFAPQQPAVKVEPVHFQAPAVPRPAVPPLPAIAPPKGKLEAMVPVLLVINTFLLIVLLLVVVFALKGR